MRELPLTRRDLQVLADLRVKEAAILVKNHAEQGAYYLGGYAVECALKACIAKLVNQHDFPDKELAQRCYTHKIEALVDVAGLVPQRNADAIANPALARNWLSVKDWDEKARYMLWTESDAREIFMAVADTMNGVLQWIKLRW